MTTMKSRKEMKVKYGRRNVKQSLVIIWSALTKAIEKDKTIADIVVGAKASSEAWKILNGDSSEKTREQTNKNFEGLSMDNSESMKEYIPAQSL